MASIDKLPNEMLNVILDFFFTSQLLPLTLINRRFRDVIADIFHLRIKQTSSLPGRELIIECYAERARLTTPSLAGYFMRSHHGGGREPPPSGNPDLLASTGQWYSVFRPYEANVLWPWAGLTVTGAAGEPPIEDVFLDEGQGECELITRALVRDSSRLIPVGEGVVRIDRQWLAELAGPVATSVVGGGTGEAGGPPMEDEENILWTDQVKRDMGIRFRVRPGRAERMPVLTSADEMPPMTFSLQHDAFIIRSRLLLLAVERMQVGEQLVASSVGALVAFA